MLNNESSKIKILSYKNDPLNNMDILDLTNNLAQKNNCTIQVMDARNIAGENHILHATIHAINSFSRDSNIANNLGMEICIRTSAQRQISKALDLIGINKDTTDLYIVIVYNNENLDVNTIIQDLNNDLESIDYIPINWKSIINTYNIKNEDKNKSMYMLMEKITNMIISP